MDEIEDHLNSQGLFSKEVVRFKKPQSTEASTTVKVVFGSHYEGGILPLSPETYSYLL